MTDPVTTTAATGGVLGSILNAFNAIANILVIVDFFTATMKPEVHEIYGYTYDTRENLKKIMKKLGVPYNIEIPKDIQNNWEKMTEFFKESKDSRIDAQMLKYEMEGTYSKSFEEITKKLYEKTIEIHEKYPAPFTIPMAEEEAKPIEEGQAKAERDKISGEVKEVGEKVEELKTSAGGGAAFGFAGTAIFSLILSSLGRIEGQLKAEQTGGGEPGEEKSGEEKSDREIIVESITNRIDKLEEKQESKLQKIEDNVLNRIASLIDLIKKSAMPFKDIYDRLCRELEREWRSSRK